MAQVAIGASDRGSVGGVPAVDLSHPPRHVEADLPHSSYNDGFDAPSGGHTSMGTTAPALSEQNSNPPVPDDDASIGERTSLNGSAISSRIRLGPGYINKNYRRNKTKHATSPKILRFQDAIRAVMWQNKMREITSHWQQIPKENRQLCDSCKELDLNVENFIYNDREGSRTINQPRRPPRQLPFQSRELGTMRAILGKSGRCPLCNLIMRSLAEQPNPKLRDVVQRRNYNSTLAQLDATCEAAWHIDGKEIQKDREGRPSQHQKPKTRRLRLHWTKDNMTDSGMHDSYLVLVAPNDLIAPKQLFLGRPLAPQSLNRGNEELCKQWYNLCSQNHVECRAESDDRFENLRQESYFGVVDLDEGRLTALPKDEDYAALSYTWGEDLRNGVENFKTNVTNVEALQHENGVWKVFDKLPRAIQDSMDLAHELGFRYLWIDSLCILQGDQEIWQLNASAMDLVYGNASLTICAADGFGARFGLTALSAASDDDAGGPSTAHAEVSPQHPRRATQYIATYKPGLDLMVSYISEFYIGRTAWNSRAWTFQERLLSRRSLIFAEGRMYFQCRTTTMCEDIHSEREYIGWSLELHDSPIQNFKNPRSGPVEVYIYCVELFTKRVLGQESDILAAFGGMARVLCDELGGQPLFGLPTSHFDLALLWTPEDAPQRRDKESLKFPSWSWCGWKGESMRYHKSVVQDLKYNIHDWLMKHTWITWYVRDGRGNLRLVWDAALDSSNPVPDDERWHGYSTTLKESAAHSVLEAGRAPSRLSRADSGEFDLYGRRVRTDMLRHCRDEFEQTLPKYPFQVRMVKPGDGSSRADTRLVDQRYLQFWTWSAHFYLLPAEEKHDAFSKDPTVGLRSRRYLVQDASFDTVGTIVLSAKFEVNAEVPHHFIAISDSMRFTEEELVWNFYANAAPGQSDWDVYNVLLLGYEEDPVQKRIARRLGLGKVLKQAFESACDAVGNEHPKEWKEIILG